jgi:hypothetical protein
MRMTSLGRSRIYELLQAREILAKMDGRRNLIIHASIVAWLDRLKPWGGSTDPLLPPEDQALARERAGGPDFAGIFTERFERLVPSLGENQAWTRALAHTIRRYRAYHKCAYKAASAAVRALIPSKQTAPPPAESETDSIGPLLSGEDHALPAPIDQQREPAAFDFGAVYENRFRQLRSELSEAAARTRALEFTAAAYASHHNCDLPTAIKMVREALAKAKTAEAALRARDSTYPLK